MGLLLELAPEGARACKADEPLLAISNSRKRQQFLFRSGPWPYIKVKTEPFPGLRSLVTSPEETSAKIRNREGLFRVVRRPDFPNLECNQMIASGVARTNTELPMADEFDRRADDFAALAENAASLEECLRYRDLEQSYRMRATEERVRQVSQLHKPRAINSAAA
jgi:hypothetical protein